MLQADWYLKKNKGERKYNRKNYQFMEHISKRVEGQTHPSIDANFKHGTYWPIIRAEYEPNFKYLEPINLVDFTVGTTLFEPTLQN